MFTFYYYLGEGGVESPYLLRDLPKLSHIHQTKGFEVFHSVCPEEYTLFLHTNACKVHFAIVIAISLNILVKLKSLNTYLISIIYRLCVAALHYNENGTRRQSMTKEGKQQWRVCYPKANKGQECIVKPERVPATFGMYKYILK